MVWCASSRATTSLSEQPLPRAILATRVAETPPASLSPCSLATVASVVALTAAATAVLGVAAAVSSSASVKLSRMFAKRRSCCQGLEEGEEGESSPNCLFMCVSAKDINCAAISSSLPCLFCSLFRFSPPPPLSSPLLVAAVVVPTARACFRAAWRALKVNGGSSSVLNATSSFVFFWRGGELSLFSSGEIEEGGDPRCPLSWRME
mmetsp:Transcript_30034/g.61343  ORF Transcript_30034/g.61343 Transcript_30034/m.61343 type:complete len:206 (+) Transcript_30034:180-797(+)